MAEAPITARPHVFYVRPAPGWLELVLDEVTSIIQSPLQKYKFEPKITLLKSTVKVHRCDWRQGLELLMRLTTAHDVEWLVLESKCNQWSEVDAILARVPWDSILPNRGVPVHVSADASNGFTTASGKLRDNFCRIAEVKHVSEGADFRFKIELRGEMLRILISLAGDPLYKRGYKSKMTAVAPLPEHQAAACARWVLSDLEKDTKIETVFVPFAGSGTLGFETILALSGGGPGSFRRQFACDAFPATPAATMKFLRQKLRERLNQFHPPKVILNDFNSSAIAILDENIKGFSEKTNFEVIEGDVFETKIEFPSTGSILILLNPPYGNRLAQDSSIEDLYFRLGGYLNKFNQTDKGRVWGGCICPDESSWRAFLESLKAKSVKTRHFTHGGNEMRIVKWADVVK